MPEQQLQSFADKSGKSLPEVEELWKQAKSIVKKEYPDVSEDDDKFYALVTGVLKKSLGLKESFLDIVDAELSRLDEVEKKEKEKEKDMDEDEEDEEVDEEEDEDGKKSKKKEKDMDEDEEDEEVKKEKE